MINTYLKYLLDNKIENKKQSLKAKQYLEEILESVIASRGNKDDQDNYLGNWLIESILKDAGVEDNNYFLFSNSNIRSLINQVLDEKILVDGVSYAVISRGNKEKKRLDLHENLRNTLNQLREKENIIICTGVFSVSQAVWMREHNMLPPADPSELPLSKDYSNATSIFDTQLVVVRALKDFQEFDRKAFTRELLLSTVKIKIKDDKVFNIITKYGVSSLVEVRESSLWKSNSSDSIEMLKKTAIRKILKNLIYRG